MSDTKTYIVALNSGVDYDAFWNEIENASPDDGFVPARRVDIVNNRSAYIRLCEYALSDSEAIILRTDPRVLAVERPVKDLPFVKIVNNVVTQDNSFVIRSISNDDNVNWGLIRHSMPTNAYKTTAFTEEKYKYNLTGEGVDIVISDLGVMPNHPEWWFVGAVHDGGLTTPISRFQSINWSTHYSGYTDSQYPSSDDKGHGTFVASVAAGRTYGWAKQAHIYSLSYGDFSGANANDPLDSFEALINWHKAKTNNRPTVMNMSWDLRLDFNVLQKKYDDLSPDWRHYITHVGWRGTVAPGWNHAKHPAPNTKGVYYEHMGLIMGPDLVPGQSLGKPSGLLYPSDAYNAALAEVIDAGIIVVQSAGNTRFLMEKFNPTGGMENYTSAHDWNNYFHFEVHRSNTGEKVVLPADEQPWPPTHRVFYNRGASPIDPRSIVVGALGQHDTTGPKWDDGKDVPRGDRIWDYSTRGPRIDVWAAGANILAATSNNSDSDTKEQYQHGEPNAFQDLYWGTSFAAPQVAGMIALRLEQQPLPNIKAKTNTETMKAWVVANSIKDQIFDNSKKLKIATEFDPITKTGAGDAILGSANYSARLALHGAPNRIAYMNTTGQDPTKIIAGSFKVGESYIIASVGTTDYTLIGATNNTVGTTFIATGPGTGTGTASRIDLPPPVKYRLTVRRDGGDGNGQVTSDPVGISFGVNQMQTYFDYTPETMVTLTAIQSAADSVWSGWLGDLNTIFVDPMATSVTIKMDQDRLINATFTLRSYQVLPAGQLISQGCVPGTYLHREVRAVGGPAYLTYNVDTPNSTQCGYVPGVGITEINYNEARDGDFTNFLLSGQFVGWVGDITSDNLKISVGTKANFIANTQLMAKIDAIPDYIVSVGYGFYGSNRIALIEYLIDNLLVNTIDGINDLVDNYVGSTVAMLALPGGKLVSSNNALIITDNDKLYSRATTPSAQAQFQIKKSQVADSVGDSIRLIRDNIREWSYNWPYEGDMLGVYMPESELAEVEVKLNEAVDELFVLVSSILDQVDLYGFMDKTTAPALPPTAPMIVDIAITNITSGGTQ
jgi:subtilisin family serine protease